MKSLLAGLCIALIFGFLGGISSQFFQSSSTPVVQDKAEQNTDIPNPFQIQTESSDLALEIAQIRQKVNRLEVQSNEIAQNQAAIIADLEDTTKNSTGKSVPQLPAASRKDNLVSAGVNPDIADDILGRMRQQQFRRMELRNLMRRNSSSDTRQYRDELRELDENRISLRSELGDDNYDQYLIVSGLNNRVKVSSVVAGSPAELNGVQKDDVILYYGGQKIMNVYDMQQAASGGDIGGFVNVEILRDGNRMNLTVPRGTLGVRLDAMQLEPVQ
jgi:hypothetical protein